MSIFLACAIALQLVLWLVPSMMVSAVSVAFLGFFLGPLFPAGVVMVVKLLPKYLHVSSIGFATALGGTGGAVFPFSIGAIAQAKGVEVLQPVVLALLLGVMALWLAFPRKSKRTA
jgi:fucose permease